jgi:hypothetical protein
VKGGILISPSSRDWKEYDIGKSSPACILMVRTGILPLFRGRYSVVSETAILTNHFPSWILSSLASCVNTTWRWSCLKFGESIELERESTYLRWEAQPCCSHCRLMPVSVACGGRKRKRLICLLFSGSLIVPIARYNFNPLPPPLTS